MLFQYFTALTLMSIPVCIWMKRYSPLFAGGLIGTGADVWEAKVKCGAMADEVYFDTDYDVQLDDVIVERENLEKVLQEQLLLVFLFVTIKVFVVFIHDSILGKETRELSLWLIKSVCF